MARTNNEMTAVGLQYLAGGIQVTAYRTGMKDSVTATNTEAEGDSVFPFTAEAGDEAEGKTEGADALSAFLRDVFFKIFGDDDFSMLRVMVTIPDGHDSVWEKMPEALTAIGIPRRHVYLQDYLSSFYYYAVNQKKELWKSDVALLEYENGEMLGYVLTIDRAKSPAVADVQQCARMRVDETMREERSDEEWNREKDRLFFEFLKRVFERRQVVTCYLLSDFYDRSWGQRSFQYLCYHRHAFQGKNLYTKGACYAAMERCGMLTMPSILYMGRDIIRQNLGMMLRVKGKEMLYPLIRAGVNWYEAHFEQEIIPDGEENLTLISTPMEGGEPAAHVLRLDHFPDRPNRATRLLLSVYYTSPKKCTVECEDLGFGEMYRSTGRKWSREIAL